jgi:hypothetical protein
MYTRNTAAGCLAIAVTVMVLGCDKSPTSPGPRPPFQPPPPPLPQARTLSVVSGWDQSAVAGAQVRVNDTMLTTDAQGQFVCSETVPAEAEIDVDAPGFFPHRTRLFGVPPTNLILLWPVAGDAEAAAIRAMAFSPSTGGQFRLSRLGWGAYYLVLLTAGDPRTPSEISGDWIREYEEIAELTGLPLSISFTTRADMEEFQEEVIVVFDGTEETCRDPWGFCPFWNSSFPYFSRPVRIVSALANRRDVIRRVLVSGLLNPNPLPGLLNRSTPAADLSLLEKQTLRMQSLRPQGTRWPDTAPFR